MSTRRGRGTAAAAPTGKEAVATGGDAHPAGLRLLLVLLFAASGCAGLIYEIVWFDLLQLAVGSSAVSLAVVLGTFMTGLCAGSLMLPRWMPVAWHPLKAYALIEAAIGVVGLLALFVIPSAGAVYASGVGHGLPGLLLRGVLCAVCLLPPTILMGATLPAVARWVEATPRGLSWLGWFYGGNVGGAVIGCLLAGFYLLRVHDVATASYVAVALNGTVALLAYGVAAFHPWERRASVPQAAGRWTGDRAVYLAVALSGFAALSAEVVWTRLLSLLLGGTVYTFSIILAVFLAAMGIGSGFGALLSRSTFSPRLALALCQALLMGALAWAALMLATSLPYWPVNPSLSTSPWFAFQIDLVRCIWAIAPAALLWGASFPLALASAGKPGEDPARLVAGVYAANTIGAIVGAVGGSLVMVPWLGSQAIQRMLVVVSATAAALLLASSLRGMAGAGTAGVPLARTASRRAIFTALIVTPILMWLAVAAIPPVPGLLAAYGRHMVTWLGQVEVVYTGEGLNASVAVSEFPDGVRNFHVSGKTEASSHWQDMRLQRMLAHLPALVHANPRSVLVVGCGAGVTAGSFVPYADIGRIVIAEIEPLIPKVVTTYFRQQNNDVIRNPRVQVVYDDARHYLATTGETFDIITSDPIHPWVRGSATLYTKEYFEMVRRHLKPGGMTTQWVPLYESDADAIRMIIATFLQVFPEATIWGNARGPGGIDVVLMGGIDRTRIDVSRLEARIDQDYAGPVAESLRGVRFMSAVELLATYLGRGPDLQPWLRNAEINLDRTLRLQYLAGLELNSYQSQRIFEEMLGYRRFPDGLFVVSEWNGAALRAALASNVP